MKTIHQTEAHPHTIIVYDKNEMVSNVLTREMQAFFGNLVTVIYSSDKDLSKMLTLKPMLLITRAFKKVKNYWLNKRLFKLSKLQKAETSIRMFGQKMRSFYKKQRIFRSKMHLQPEHFRKFLFTPLSNAGN